MFYQEKRIAVSIAAGMLMLIAYCIFALTKIAQGGPAILTDLRFWAVSMLVFVAIGIGAIIAILILFHIVQATVNAARGKEQDFEEKEDELDKLIALKATKGVSISAGVGFIAALITLVLNQPPVLMLNIIFVSFQIGTLVEGFLQLHYYKRGIRHG